MNEPVSIRETVDPYGEKVKLDGGALMTDAEHRLLDLLSQVVRGFTEVYEADVQRGDSNPNTHTGDLHEVVNHVHDLLARVLARAAARAYPGRYRLL
jgi:hypothetical protein